VSGDVPQTEEETCRPRAGHTNTTVCCGLGAAFADQRECCRLLLVDDDCTTEDCGHGRLAQNRHRCCLALLDLTAEEIEQEHLPHVCSNDPFHLPIFTACRCPRGTTDVDACPPTPPPATQPPV
jgi:hypothetical protein